MLFFKHKGEKMSPLEKHYKEQMELEKQKFDAFLNSDEYEKIDNDLAKKLLKTGLYHYYLGVTRGLEIAKEVKND